MNLKEYTVYKGTQIETDIKVKWIDHGWVFISNLFLTIKFCSKFNPFFLSAFETNC
jgi:hypothetical protein